MQNLLDELKFLSIEEGERKRKRKEEEKAPLETEDEAWRNYTWKGALDDIPQNSLFCTKHPNYKEIIRITREVREQTRKERIEEYLLRNYNLNDEEFIKWLLEQEEFEFNFDDWYNSDINKADIIKAYINEESVNIEKNSEDSDFENYIVDLYDNLNDNNFLIYLIKTKVIDSPQESWNNLDNEKKLNFITNYVNEKETEPENFQDIFNYENKWWSNDWESVREWYLDYMREFNFDPDVVFPQLRLFQIVPGVVSNYAYPFPEEYIGYVPIKVSHRTLKDRFSDEIMCFVGQFRGTYPVAYHFGKLNLKTWTIKLLRIKINNRLHPLKEYGGWSEYMDRSAENITLLDLRDNAITRNERETFPLKIVDPQRFTNVYTRYEGVSTLEINVLNKFSKEVILNIFGTIKLDKNTRMYHSFGEDLDSSWMCQTPIRGPAFFACNQYETHRYFGTNTMAFFSRKEVELLDLVNDSRKRNVKYGFEPYGRSLLRWLIYGSIAHHGQLGYPEDRDAKYLKDIGIDGWFSYDAGNIADGEFMITDPIQTLTLYGISLDRNRMNSLNDFCEKMDKFKKQTS